MKFFQISTFLSLKSLSLMTENNPKLSLGTPTPHTLTAFGSRPNMNPQQISLNGPPGFINSGSYNSLARLYDDAERDTQASRKNPNLLPVAPKRVNPTSHSPTSDPPQTSNNPNSAPDDAATLTAFEYICTHNPALYAILTKPIADTSVPKLRIHTLQCNICGGPHAESDHPSHNSPMMSPSPVPNTPSPPKLAKPTPKVHPSRRQLVQVTQEGNVDMEPVVVSDEEEIAAPETPIQLIRKEHLRRAKERAKVDHDNGLLFATEADVMLKGGNLFNMPKEEIIDAFFQALSPYWYSKMNISSSKGSIVIKFIDPSDVDNGTSWLHNQKKTIASFLSTNIKLLIIKPMECSYSVMAFLAIRILKLTVILYSIDVRYR
jgi:hypothetical protein